MSDISLDSNWDIHFDDTGDIVFVEGPEETSQASKFRLQLIRGELFEDQNLGVPWLTDMVDPLVSMGTKKQILSRTILSSPGALSLTSLEVQFDTDNNLALGKFTGIADSGTFSGEI